MALGTRRKGRGVKWDCIIPEHLAVRAETLFVDPSTKRPIYGFKSQLMTELLEKWVAEQEATIRNSPQPTNGVLVL